MQIYVVKHIVSLVGTSKGFFILMFILKNFFLNKKKIIQKKQKMWSGVKGPTFFYYQ